MSMRPVSLDTKNFFYVIQELITKDHAFWRKHGEVILAAWKADDACLYGFMATYDETKSEKIVPCFTLLNKENKSVVELLWVSPFIRRNSVATIMIKLLNIVYILSPPLLQEEDQAITTFCSYFPRVKRISSLAQCNVVIDLCEEEEEEEEERCSKCQCVKDDLALCSGFACSTKTIICTSNACSTRCLFCDQSLCLECGPFCRCEPLSIPAAVDPMMVSEKEALELDTAAAVLPTSQEMIDQKVVQLKDQRGVVLTQSGNESSGSTYPGSPINRDFVERARSHIKHVFARSSTFNPIHSYGLKGSIEGWRKNHVPDEDYYLSHGDFIMAMILEGYCFKFREDYSALVGQSSFSCQFNCVFLADLQKEEEEEEESEYGDSDSDCMIVEIAK